MDRKKQMRTGFSLIELLVAIAIMAVLIALVLPNYLGARERARDTKLKAEMNQLNNAMRSKWNVTVYIHDSISMSRFLVCSRRNWRMRYCLYEKTADAE